VKPIVLFNVGYRNNHNITLRRTDGIGYIDSASVPDHEYIYFMGSVTLNSTCYILSDESCIPTFFQLRLFEEVDILRRILKRMGIESIDLSIDNKSIAKTHITVRAGTCPIKIKILINFK